MKKISAILFALMLTACATSGPRIAAPNLIKAPQPIVGNTGKYMSPYTEDGTVAAWVEKGRNAGIGANIGGFVGAQAGQKVAENIPFVGGFLGQKIGETAGRALAIKMAGGEEFIRANSDLSFNNINDMAVYMYAKNSTHKDFAQALKLAQDIYPELKTAYYPAIINASAGK
ncbi:hypothetical protein [Massilia sp. SYSU DXS3249]